MLIEFAVTNYRSIKERQALLFHTETRLSKNEHPQNVISSLPAVYKTNLLKMLCIYGANASGKSNMLRALYALQKITTEPPRKNDHLDYQPFALDLATLQAPTTLELTFVARNQLKYEYRLSFNADTVLHESLFFYANNPRRSSKTKLYEVDRQTETPVFSYGAAYQGDRFSARNLHPNQTILSKVGDSPIASLLPAYDYIDQTLDIILFKEKESEELQQAILGASDFVKTNLILLAKEADFGIQGLLIEKMDIKEDIELQNFKNNIAPFISDDILPIPQEDMEGFKKSAEYDTLMRSLLKKIHTIQPPPTHKVTFSRHIYDGARIAETKSVWALAEESGGTLSFLWLAAQLLSAIELGKVLIVDEIEENLHSKLLPLLLGFFNTAHNNPHNAQLVVTAHDTNLMERNALRLDQMVLVDKNPQGASQVYRISDFEGISKLETIERAYLQGRFGAVPIVARKENIFLQFPKTKHNAQP